MDKEKDLKKTFEKTEESKRNIVDSAIIAGRMSTEIQILNEKVTKAGIDVPGHVILSSEPFEMHSLENFLERPLKKRGEYTFEETESFVDFVNKHKIIGETTIQSFQRNDSFRVICTFDDHSKEQPGRHEFRAILILKFSDQWINWFSKSGKPMNQIEFADFIEDNRLDFMAGQDSEGKNNITAVELMAMVVNLQETRTWKISSKVNRHDGTFEFMSKNEKTGTDLKITVPERFALVMPIFKGGGLKQINIRLRYPITDDVIKFVYMIDNAEKTIDDAYHSIRKYIEKGKVSNIDSSSYPGTEIKVWA